MHWEWRGNTGRDVTHDWKRNPCSGLENRPDAFVHYVCVFVSSLGCNRDCVFRMHFAGAGQRPLRHGQVEWLAGTCPGEKRTYRFGF